MKIAFIGQKGLPATRGIVEKYVEKIAVNLAEMGHEVSVYVRNNYTEKKLTAYKGVKLIHIPSLPTKNLDTISYSFLATIHSLFRRYDVIHYQSIGPSSLSFIPKFLKRKTAILATFHYRTYLDQKWGRLAKKYLELGEKIACTVSDAIIVPRKTLRSYIFNKHQRRAIYIPSGARIKYNSDTKVLERWNLKDKKYILSEGKIYESRGLYYLIEAFRKLEETNKLPNNFKLVIIEEDSDSKKKADSIKNNVIFTSTHTGSTLEQLFSHAYLFVQPSKIEAFSSYLLEAMGCGIAPLVSDFQENLEVIGKCGFAFHARSKENLEEKLAYLLNKNEEVEKIGKMAKERVKKDFSWETTARKTLRVYELSAEGKIRNKLGALRKKAESYT